MALKTLELELFKKPNDYLLEEISFELNSEGELTIFCCDKFTCHSYTLTPEERYKVIKWYRKAEGELKLGA